MSEFMFGVRRGTLTKEERAVRYRAARKHGCGFIYVKLPGTGFQSWFAGPNRGNPFDRDLAAAVLGELPGDEP